MKHLKKIPLHLERTPRQKVFPVKASTPKIRKLNKNRASEEGRKETLQKGIKYALFGEILQNNFKFTEALACYVSALPLYIRVLGKNHIKLADVYNHLGSIHEILGNYDSSLLNYSQAVRILERSQENNILLIGKIYARLASIQCKKALFKESYTSAMKSSELNKQVISDDDAFEFVEVYTAFGELYEKTAQFEKSTEYYLKVLEIKLKNLGENDSSTADTYRKLACVMIQQGKYQSALESIEKAFLIYEKSFQKDHYVFAEIYLVLAQVKEAFGEYQEAKDLLQRAFEVQSLYLDTNHINFARIENESGKVCSQINLMEDAWTSYEKALKIYTRKFGNSHPDVADVLLNMGQWSYSQGKLIDAMAYLQKSQAIYQQYYDENHPQLATCYNSVGLVHCENKNFKEAFQYLEEGLKIRLRKFKDAHLSVAHSCNSIGITLYSERILDQALINFEKAIDITKKLFPEGHFFLVTLYNNATFASFQKGNSRYTMKCFNESLNLSFKYQSVDYSKIGDLFEKMGTFYLDCKLYSRAIKDFQRAILARQVLSENNKKIIDAIKKQIEFAEMRIALTKHYYD